MGLGCGGACMKYILFFFNFIFFVCGAVILGVGIWVRVDPKVADYVGLTVDKGSYEAATILLIAVGAFILLVGFLGCCGACQESTCMLCLFAGLMIVIVLLQVIAAILAVVFQSQVEKELKENLTKDMKERVGNDPTDPITQAVNRMQLEFKCCGTVNYKDYGEYSNIYNTTMPDGKLVPKSCCKKADAKDGVPELSNPDWATCSAEAEKTNPSVDILFQTGCYDSLVGWLNDHTIYVIAVGFGLAVVELFGIVFACCVRSKISEQNY